MLKATHSNAYSKKNKNGVWQRNHVYVVTGTAKEMQAYNAFQAKREASLNAAFPKDEAGNYLFYVVENAFQGIFGDPQIALRVNPVTGNVGVDRDNERNANNRSLFAQKQANMARIAAELEMGIVTRVQQHAAAQQTAAATNTSVFDEPLDDKGTDTGTGAPPAEGDKTLQEEIANAQLTGAGAEKLGD